MFKKKPGKTKQSVYIVDLNEDLKNLIEGYAVQEGISVKDVLERMIKLGIIIITSDFECYEASVVVRKYEFDGEINDEEIRFAGNHHDPDRHPRE